LGGTEGVGASRTQGVQNVSNAFRRVAWEGQVRIGQITLDQWEVSNAFRRVAWEGLLTVAETVARIQLVSNAFRRVAWEGPKDSAAATAAQAAVSNAFRRVAWEGPNIKNRELQFGLVAGLQCLSAGGLGGTSSLNKIYFLGRNSSPMPFGGWLGRDKMHLDSRVSRIYLSPMPFGGWLGRDGKKVKVDPSIVKSVSNAFRRVAWEGRPFTVQQSLQGCARLQCLSAGGLGGTRSRAFGPSTATKLSPMPFGGWLGRDCKKKRG